MQQILLHRVLWAQYSLLFTNYLWLLFEGNGVVIRVKSWRASRTLNNEVVHNKLIWCQGRHNRFWIQLFYLLRFWLLRYEIFWSLIFSLFLWCWTHSLSLLFLFFLLVDDFDLVFLWWLWLLFFYSWLLFFNCWLCALWDLFQLLLRFWFRFRFNLFLLNVSLVFLSLLLL